jgi:hypothetical protein
MMLRGILFFREWRCCCGNKTKGSAVRPLSDDSDHTRTLYPDGKKHEEKDENRKKISTKTEWQGDALIAETKMHSGELTETYQVSSDGRQLTVVSRYENSSLSRPLSIRRVYDTEKAVRDSEK